MYAGEARKKYALPDVGIPHQEDAYSFAAVAGPVVMVILHVLQSGRWAARAVFFLIIFFKA